MVKISAGPIGDPLCCEARESLAGVGVEGHRLPVEHATIELRAGSLFGVVSSLMPRCLTLRKRLAAKAGSSAG
jgi:hypothetical protein